MTVTIYDVAREAGVSMATVSRVVNGNPNVKPSTRKKVLQVIEELGYRPNAVARGLASKKTTTIGVVLPDISNVFFAELARGIDDISGMFHYDIILSSSDQNVNTEIQLINNLLEKQVDGVLFIGGRITEEHHRIFSTTYVPIVLVSTYDPFGKLPSVRINLEQAAFEATEFLIKKGHTSIGYLTGPRELLTIRARYEGYVRALKEYGLPYQEELVVEGAPVYEMSLEGVKKVMQSPNRPTAIFSMNDEMAVGAIHAIQDIELRVPEDVEVVGFNNTRMAQMVRPMLTSVVQPMYDLGAVSMRLLTKLINNEEIEELDIVLPHRIEFRQSTRL